METLLEILNTLRDGKVTALLEGALRGDITSPRDFKPVLLKVPLMNFGLPGVTNTQPPPLVRPPGLQTIRDHQRPRLLLALPAVQLLPPSQSVSGREGENYSWKAT